MIGGCGKFFDKTRDFVLSHGAYNYFPYDPFNAPAGENLRTLNYGFVCDTAFCCNVLNVIDSDDQVIETIKSVCNRLCVGGIAYFQIYEGNKSGIGSVTKKDCYQRNSKTVDYMFFFQFCLSALSLNVSQIISLLLVESEVYIYW